MASLLDALTRRNVPINISNVPPGINTKVRAEFNFDSWRPWEDFTYPVLTRIFSLQLRQPYTGDREPTPLYHDLELFDENGLEDVLRRFVSPVVNFSLQGQPGAFHLGRGSRCKEDGVPDWSLVSNTCLDEDTGCYLNILPGDTKLSVKWWPSIITDDYIEWQKVMEQIVFYMTAVSSRYGFIITDAYLVPLRLTRTEIEAGIATGLRTRVAAVPAVRHQHQLSDVSMASTTSYGSSSNASSYHDDDPVKWEYHDPEYALIPWSTHGADKLTVKLGLWCLAMMAINDNHIDYWYPDLDSWRHSTRHGFVHNTSGARKKTLSKEDKLHESPSGISGDTAAGSSLSNAAEDAYSYEPEEGNEASSSNVAGYYYETGESSRSGGILSSVAGYAESSGQSSTSSAQGYSLPAREVYQAGGSETANITPSQSVQNRVQYGEGEDVNDNDDDADTEVGLSSRQKRRRTVEVKRHRFTGRGYYFVDANNIDRETTKSKWRKVDGGYEYEGRKYIYFTKSFLSVLQHLSYDYR